MDSSYGVLFTPSCYDCRAKGSVNNIEIIVVAGTDSAVLTGMNKVVGHVREKRQICLIFRVSKNNRVYLLYVLYQYK